MEVYENNIMARDKSGVDPIGQRERHRHCAASSSSSKTKWESCLCQAASDYERPQLRRRTKRSKKHEDVRDLLLYSLEWVAAVDFGAGNDAVRPAWVSFSSVSSGDSSLQVPAEEFEGEALLVGNLRYLHRTVLGGRILSVATSEEQLFLSRVCGLPVFLVSEAELRHRAAARGRTTRESVVLPSPVVDRPPRQNRNSYYRAWRCATLLEYYRRTLFPRHGEEKEEGPATSAESPSDNRRDGTPLSERGEKLYPPSYYYYYCSGGGDPAAPTAGVCETTTLCRRPRLQGWYDRNGPSGKKTITGPAREDGRAPSSPAPPATPVPAREHDDDDDDDAEESMGSDDGERERVKN